MDSEEPKTHINYFHMRQRFFFYFSRLYILIGRLYRYVLIRVLKLIGWIHLRANGAVLAEGIVVLGPPAVRNQGKMIIGAGSIVISHSSCTTMGISQRTLFTTLTKKAQIIVGKGCALSGAVICAQRSIELGDGVMLGSGVVIMDTDFHSLNPLERGTGHDLDYALSKPVKIGNNCFIGARAIIGKGVVLGDNTIVGAGAVVCRSFPSNVVVAGNPAQVVKSLRLDGL